MANIQQLLDFSSLPVIPHFLFEFPTKNGLQKLPQTQGYKPKIEGNFQLKNSKK